MTGSRVFRYGRVALPVALVMVASLGVGGASAATDRADTLKAAKAAGPVAQGSWITEKLTKKDVDWYRFDVANSGRVMATLGGLPADYTLGLYNSAGTKVAGSARSGVKFERVAARVRPGSYFVKVSSSGAYSATSYSLKFAVPAAGVTVLNKLIGYDTYQGSPVNFWIAEVYNNTSSWQSVTGWHTTFYGAGGAELGAAGESYSRARPLAPGAVMSIHSGDGAHGDSSPAGTKSLRIGVDAKAIAAPAVKYTVKRLSTKKVTGGYRYAVRVTNSGAKKLPLLVSVSKYTAFGNLGDLTETNGTVAAGTAETWTFTVPGKAANYTRVSVVPGS